MLSESKHAFRDIQEALTESENKRLAFLGGEDFIRKSICLTRTVFSFDQQGRIAVREGVLASEYEENVNDIEFTSREEAFEYLSNQQSEVLLDEDMSDTDRLDALALIDENIQTVFRTAPDDFALDSAITDRWDFLSEEESQKLARAGGIGAVRAWLADAEINPVYLFNPHKDGKTMTVMPLEDFLSEYSFGNSYENFWSWKELGGEHDCKNRYDNVFNAFDSNFGASNHVDQMLDAGDIEKAEADELFKLIADAADHFRD